LEEKLDGRVYRTSGVRGDVAIIPAGTPVEFRSREREPQQVESLAVRLDPAFLRGIAADADMDPVELVGGLGGRDLEIERIGSSLLSELENDGSSAISTSTPWRRPWPSASSGTTPPSRGAARGISPPECGLPAATLRRVTDYVEENLARNPTLAELSGVHEPVPLFGTFKVSTGLLPHQYVIQRRVEKAKRLLVNTRLPLLLDISHLCGFADQSHLAKHTRRLLGTTPRALRLLAPG
jgi:AraC family transcriptional regulator